MLEVVSRLTGYPIEMLNMDMDIESVFVIREFNHIEPLVYHSLLF